MASRLPVGEQSDVNHCLPVVWHQNVMSTNSRRHLFQPRDVCAGAIGSAEWSGVKLRDVLRYAGFDEDSSDGVAHVQFEGLDSDISGTCYGASIPIDKAMGSHADVILAFSMNGRSEHGIH